MHCVSHSAATQNCPTLWRVGIECPRPDNTVELVKSLLFFDSSQPTSNGFFNDVSVWGSATAYGVGTAGIIVRVSDADTCPPGSGKLPAEQQQLPAALGVMPPDLNAVFTLDDKTVWAVGDDGVIVHTRNGQTWIAQQSDVDVDLHDVVFTDSDNGWAAGAKGTVLRTSDGGDTWVRERTSVTETLRALSFPTSSVGFAVGDAGTILKWLQNP
jgi:hypothetical protein